jgi:adenylate cyclase
VRKSGSRLRITGQLIDALTGSHLWADRFDGGLEDVFDLQDKITESVVGAIEPTLRKVEIERARRKPAENLDAYDLYLRALPHVHAFRPDENLVGLQLLRKAIDLDTTYAPALGYATWCLEIRLMRGWPPAGQDDAGTAIGLARRAIAAGGDDALALVTGGFVLVMIARDYDTGLDAVRRALDLNPGSGFVAMLASWATVFGGNSEDALVHAERAMALSPLDPSYFLYLTAAGFGHLLSGRSDRAGIGQTIGCTLPRLGRYLLAPDRILCPAWPPGGGAGGACQIFISVAWRDDFDAQKAPAVQKPFIVRNNPRRFPQGGSAGISVWTGVRW